MKSRKDSKDLILRKALFLRYGMDQPDPANPPTALLSWRLISQMLKLPYNTVYKLQSSYFDMTS